MKALAELKGQFGIFLLSSMTLAWTLAKVTEIKLNFSPSDLYKKSFPVDFEGQNFQIFNLICSRERLM